MEGSEEAKSWKIKCKDIFEILLKEYPTITPVEAGKITKQAYPFAKRQTYHQKNGSSETYYYRIRAKQDYNKVKPAEFQNEGIVNAVNSTTISMLERKVLENEEALRLKNDCIQKITRSYSESVGQISTLRKQKRTLSKVIHDLEEKRFKQRKTSDKDGIINDTDDALVRSVTFIRKEYLLPHANSGQCIIGSGSYGTCELMNWRDIPVCVKTAHKSDLIDIKKEVAILCQLQQSLYVPILLGINLEAPPYYIVTKFHSIKADSSVTLQKALHCSTIRKSRWGKILIHCAEGIKSIHSLGFLHNDLHQKNIILDKLNGHVRPVIVDFGKACKTGDGRCRNVPNFSCYRQQHPWVAPETICGEHRESEASDVFSFGYLMDKVNSHIGCSDLGKLVLQCQSNTGSRPKLNTIIETLESICKTWLST